MPHTVYTDGSYNIETEGGGLGVYVGYPNGNEMSMSKPCGKKCIGSKAELMAMEEAIALTINNKWQTTQTVILIDAKSILEQMKNSTNKFFDKLTNILQSQQMTTTLTFQWIPAHCGLHGNERADQLAKEGSEKPQPPHTCCPNEIKQHTQIIQKNRWNQKHPKYNRYDPIHQLERRDQVRIFRLRTGHNLLRQHMFKTFRMGQGETCICNQGPENGEHVLMSCPRFHRLWPDTTPYNTKIYGCEEELRTTDGFLQQTG